MTGLPALVDARWPDVAASQRRVLVLPLGSLEQHGPHLPLDTDSYLAGALAGQLHLARPEAGLAPTMAIGASGEHADFPGTLSIGTEALAHVVVELVRHASSAWGCVFVINGHGGNVDALVRAQRICAYEGRRLRVAGIGAPGMDAHAGHAETSMMLQLAPQRVRMALAAPGVLEPIAGLDLRERGVRAISPSGVLGDPSAATAVEGARLIEIVLDRLITVYDGCLQSAQAG